MRCDEVRRCLADHAVGGLGHRVRASVLHHLGTCASCRFELSALQRTGELVSGLGPRSAPSAVWDAIRFRIRANERRRARRGWVERLAAPGLALIVLVVALSRFLPGPQLGPETMLPTQTDQDIQLTMEAHLTNVWSAPLSDPAAVGLHLESVEDDS